VVEAMKVQEADLKYDSKYIRTGIPGFDDLFEHGIPKGSSVIIAGGAGSGKTNLCLQILAHHASRGKKCYFMGFEESEQHLIDHMNDFGWDPGRLISFRESENQTVIDK
jgi:circadian clock protein KaiC